MDKDVSWISILIYSIYWKSDVDIIQENQVSINLKDFHFEPSLSYVCSFEYESIDIILTEIKQTSEDAEFERNCTKGSSDEDTNYVLDYIKTTNLHAVIFEIEEIINKIAKF